ncbi:MAG TPA: ABC transporter substrate-binding protein [Streptosporangiaceae bacterium]|jgi:peptide/nickel transport system substrate-binding protein
MRRKLIRYATVAVCAVALGAAGCTTPSGSTAGSPSGSGGKAVRGGTATFAENQASGVINCIFPIVSLSCDLPSNIQFMDLQWNPLYWFGAGGKLVMNDQLSLAEPPVYSDGNRTVSITLKPAKWSDGQPVTARDIEFFINLVRAYGTNWAYGVSGEFPGNVASMTLHGTQTIVFHLTRAYSPTWFTYSQLSEIVPLPQHAWDKDSASAQPGNLDRTPAGAKRVLGFLEKQGAQLGSYATNPLWHVVDGPWHLASFASSGYAALKPDPSYTLAPKPHLSQFVMQPFTSDSAEANDLQAGRLSYGYVPVSDLSATSRFASAGYTIQSWPLLSIAYIVLNFSNPAIGPVFRQLYARQAMQALINEPGYIKAFLGQAGVPDYGPVPARPPTPYSAGAGTNPNPYDPAKAAALLKAHGWAMSAGVLTCRRPGAGAARCGAGVAAGTKFQFTLQYLGDVPYLDNEMRSMKSTFGRAGIVLTLTTGTEGQVVGAAVPCTGGSSCGWQAVQWGTPAWIWGDPYPTGEQVFRTGAGVNPGSFSSPVVDADISAIQRATSATAVSSAWSKYSKDVSGLLPVLWIPNTVNQVSAISTKLHGATPQSPLTLLTPSQWYFSK